MNEPVDAEQTNSDAHAVRNVPLRISLRNYAARTVPALDIEAYAYRVYEANQAAGY